MPITGYVDYKKREFCNELKCPVQMELNKKEAGSDEYEKVRQTCRNNCRFTAWKFHNWLIERGYAVVRPEDKS